MRELPGSYSIARISVGEVGPAGGTEMTAAVPTTSCKTYAERPPCIPECPHQHRGMQEDVVGERRGDVGLVTFHWHDQVRRRIGLKVPLAYACACWPHK